MIKYCLIGLLSILFIYFFGGVTMVLLQGGLVLAGGAFLCWVVGRTVAWFWE